MKRIYIILAAALSVCACSKFLDTRTDVFDTMDRLQTRSSTFVLREVIETDSDEALPVVNAARSASPSATPGPNATPTPSPTPAEETWSYPSADATAQFLETLPEDEWAREQ